MRPPGRTVAPREIDIDLLLYGDAVIDEPPDLVVPHPRLLERPFVRIPLADVAAPGLVHPITGTALDRAAPDPGVTDGLSRRLKSWIVAARPSSSETRGAQSSSSFLARVMSGLRRVGSSSGSGARMISDLRAGQPP